MNRRKVWLSSDLSQQRHIEDMVTNALFLSDFSSNLNFEVMTLAVGKGDSFDCFIVLHVPEKAGC
ncbi:Uncharacterised protein [Streptococcus pneumoniae]|nr:Uncharacterised protein [Streptococcus pneumoniae]